jgi:uncharacterized protein
VTDLYLASSAPVFKVDGTVKGELARDLLRIEVEETTEGLKTLCMHLLAIGPVQSGPDERLQYLDGGVVDFGRRLEASIGPPGRERNVFDGAISALEATFEEGQIPHVSLFAEDQLMALRMTRRMRAYEDLTDAGIAEAVADAHGLSADTAAAGPTYDVVHQFGQSDLAFLRDRARLVQAELWCEHDTLNFKSRANRTGTSLTLVQGNQLIAVRLRADLAHQRSTVRVSGYDAQERATIEEEASGSVVMAEVAGGRTGPDVLTGALGERVSHRVREVPIESGEATAWARAEMLRRARQFVTVVATTSGTPDLVVGSRVTLERVGQPFEGGGYYVTRVRHTWDLSDGHRTHFEAERPTVNQVEA